MLSKVHLRFSRFFSIFILIALSLSLSGLARIQPLDCCTTFRLMREKFTLLFIAFHNLNLANCSSFFSPLPSAVLASSVYRRMTFFSHCSFLVKDNFAAFTRLRGATCTLSLQKAASLWVIIFIRIFFNLYLLSLLPLRPLLFAFR